MWSALVSPLADRTEKWWGSVMDVGLDPELTKWSVRSGPAIVLTGKGYKEHHWLVVPPSTTSVISTFLPSVLLSSCPCPLALFQELRMSSVGAVPLFESGARPETVLMPGEPLLPSCSMRKVIV